VRKKKGGVGIRAARARFQQTHKPSIRVKEKTLTAKLAKKGREGREEDLPYA